VGFFFHPLPVAAVLILALNDHYLKYHFNSWWTGKLSDFAGLFFFPLFVCTLILLLWNAMSAKRKGLSAELLVPAIVLTNVAFIAIKMVPEAAFVYERVLTGLGFPSIVTLDPTDLIALSSSLVCYGFGSWYWSGNPTQYKSSI